VNNLRFINCVKGKSNRSLVLAAIGLVIAFAIFNGCSIPNLESRDCSDARTALHEFYSFHFGNDMRFTFENLQLRKRFLTDELFKKLENAPAGGDPFTTEDEDYPRAFRVGKCSIDRMGNPNFEVLLFWKDDQRTGQRSIRVGMRKQNGGWLVERISKVNAND